MASSVVAQNFCIFSNYWSVYNITVGDFPTSWLTFLTHGCFPTSDIMDRISSATLPPVSPVRLLCLSAYFICLICWKSLSVLIESALFSSRYKSRCNLFDAWLLSFFITSGFFLTYGFSVFLALPCEITWHLLNETVYSVTHLLSSVAVVNQVTLFYNLNQILTRHSTGVLLLRYHSQAADPEECLFYYRCSRTLLSWRCRSSDRLFQCRSS